MFKPQLFPNEQIEPKDMKYPLIASYKLDGIRCIFKNGEMLSRSLKTIPNIQLHEKFIKYKKLSETGIILDGEIYSPSHTFQEITSVVMSDDKQVPNEIDFYCFDVLTNNIENYNQRIKKIKIFNLKQPTFKYIYNGDDCLQMFSEALNNGYEGLILISPLSNYKFGRHTVKSGMAYKYKPYVTFDSQIIDIQQATIVKEGLESEINELGYKKTSRKKDDRVLIPKASAFIVKYNNETLKVTIALTDKEKEEIWQNYKFYIGRWIEYKGMLVGSKDVPRHPVFIRFRDDKGY